MNRELGQQARKGQELNSGARPGVAAPDAALLFCKAIRACRKITEVAADIETGV
jgi:hypothetical protein